MKNNNLSRSNILELANIFTAKVVSIYELEKISGFSSVEILNAFNKDLYEINEKKAKEVSKILNFPGYLKCKGYIKEVARN